MSLTVEKVVDAKLHIGSLKKESSPKTSKRRQDVVNNVVVINPEKIKNGLEAAKERVKQAKKDGKEILVVCDKSMYADELKALSEKH